MRRYVFFPAPGIRASTTLGIFILPHFIFVLLLGVRLFSLLVLRFVGVLLAPILTPTGRLFFRHWRPLGASGAATATPRQAFGALPGAPRRLPGAFLAAPGFLFSSFLIHHGALWRNCDFKAQLGRSGLMSSAETKQ